MLYTIRYIKYAIYNKLYAIRYIQYAIHNVLYTIWYICNGTVKVRRKHESSQCVIVNRWCCGNIHYYWSLLPYSHVSSSYWYHINIPYAIYTMLYTICYMFNTILCIIPYSLLSLGIFILHFLKRLFTWSLSDVGILSCFSILPVHFEVIYQQPRSSPCLRLPW
jgi:hypothetical protein